MIHRKMAIEGVALVLHKVLFLLLLDLPARLVWAVMFLVAWGAVVVMDRLHKWVFDVQDG